ncbi:hypothetical protein ACS4H7_002860 [Enterococcus hirae]|uniref:hypothetical protein n=2 Tax=Enterococcus TaxID=1350 RepID=UPI003759C9E4
MYFIIVLSIQILFFIILIGVTLMVFPEIFYFIYFMISFAFSNDGTWSLLSLDSVGYLNNIAKFLQANILTWNDYLKIGLIILIVLLYLALSVFINRKGYFPFRIINLFTGILFYTVLLYSTTHFQTLEVMLAIILLSCIIIPIKLFILKIFNRKISDMLY